ncbi:MAG: PIN domain-containing protein [Smithellaceae bacterium]|nr:PIN domain-containing protein [Smithellaceae bacterium]
MAKHPLKVFLDSNVILSGLLSDRGAPRLILDVLSLRLPGLQGATGEYNIMEIERNLARKMPDLLPIYGKYLPLLDLEIVPLPSPETIAAMAGQSVDKDLPVLASALACRADYLVTGDKKDFARAKECGEYCFQVVSPAEFLAGVLQLLMAK